MKKIALLEAILFTATEPLKLSEIKKLMKINEMEILKLLEEIRLRYEDETHGIKLFDVGGFKLVIKPEYRDRVKNLTPYADMSRGLLRALSIVAFHQPIAQSEIAKVIGNRAYEYIKELEERGFIKGEKKSRTKILVTTPEFEKYFGTKSEELKKILQRCKENEHD